jgi:hypothetical protein
VAADPAEAQRGRGLVLLVRDRLDGFSRGLGDLRAAPQAQSHDRGVQRSQAQRLAVKLVRQRRQSEEHQEDRHDDRKPPPELDVASDRRAQRESPICQERSQDDADDRARKALANTLPRRIDEAAARAERSSQAVLSKAFRGELGPNGVAARIGTQSGTLPTCP